MFNRVITLKIVEWLLLILSIMNVGSAMLVIGGQAPASSLPASTLITLAVVQIVLNAFIAIGILGMMSEKRWGFWAVVVLLLLGAVLSTFPPSKWLGVGFSLVFLILLVVHWRTFASMVAPTKVPKKSR